ncbi:uncharacterized protein CC84DRAFT_1164585 [Paraphaeosphaeria sporulosa]|uniref:N-acetyltransferase domain-containing protein n=1 Tax=Paraphaeosphaeria sporulosa TaxID=1460663 RepID=A0A177CH59_9PLEO|nr:uncharacterized protein CC84DRAFT_1164585 [Paraphaeosphaeria sporulosa]OAG06282.1 hypothetical protein CC84DRAFT_1164585 [Paraphaeosphaeria sporulosa]
MSSSTIQIQKLGPDVISEEMLVQAATLFSSAYGIWGSLAQEKMSKFCKPGHRVKMSAERLRQQSLAPGTRSVLVRAVSGDKLAGYAFATRWDYQGRQVCWITQLCIDPELRSQKLATKILLALRDGEKDRGFGILSSHPHAILAALRAFGRGIEEIDMDIVKLHARGILDASPVDYVKSCKLKGTLFGEKGDDGSVCSADTGFWVDHDEPMAALEQVKAKGVKWAFGELLEGCEFIVVVKGAEVESAGDRVRRQENSSDL